MSEQEESGAVVLLIEDEVQIRRFLRASLTNNGYKLIEAATAQEGLAQFGKHLRGCLNKKNPEPWSC